MGFSLTAKGRRSGWTTLWPSSDSRLIYVDSSASGVDSGSFDATHGDINHPFKTIAYAKGFVRNGFPDWILLKCGQTWTETFGSFDNISGRSNSEKIVLTSYGVGARPIIQTSLVDGIDVGTKSDYVAITDLDFYGHTYDGTNATANAIRVTATVRGWLVEGCRIRNYQFGIVFQAGYYQSTNVQIRRNVIHDIHYDLGGSACSGMYLENLDSVLVEENILHKVGWSADIYYTFFYHGMYVHNTCYGQVIRNNLVVDGDGIQCRSGFTCTGNTLSRVKVGILWGCGTLANASGITGNCDDNCILEGKSPVPPGSFQSDYDRGVSAIRMGNVAGGTVARNIAANSLDGVDPAWIAVMTMESGNPAIPVYRTVDNCLIEDIIGSDWGGYFLSAFADGGATYTGNTMRRIVCQNPNTAVSHGYYTGGPPPTTPNYESAMINLSTSSGWTSSNFALSDSHFVRNPTLVTNHDSGGTNAVSYNGAGKTWSTFFTDIGAIACDNTQQSYPHPTEARLGKYYTYLGNTTTGSNDGDHDAFMALCKAQRKPNANGDTWDPRYTTQQINAYIKDYCFGSPW